VEVGSFNISREEKDNARSKDKIHEQIRHSFIFRFKIFWVLVKDAQVMSSPSP
jgi:hypothetical protein